jgi:glycosyltransferase involved in cell wall biosynthesis
VPQPHFLPVSVCIPVRNEEANIGACIDALRNAFDDVVVVDSGSTDGTREIAVSKEARVVEFRWNGRFPKKRNWAIRNVPFAHPWILFLDADEHLTQDFIDELRCVLPGTSHTGFWLSFTNYFLDQPLRHGDVFRKLALFRRGAGEYEWFPEEWWSQLDMEVHEHPVLTGTTGAIRSRIEHRDYRGLHHYLAKHNDYSTWEANRYLWLAKADSNVWSGLTSRQRFKYRHLKSWWLAHFYWAVCLIVKRGFLDGAAGGHFARLKKQYFQAIRLKIIEMQSMRAGTVAARIRPQA